jgi:hypothetical protein
MEEQFALSSASSWSLGLTSRFGGGGELSFFGGAVVLSDCFASASLCCCCFSVGSDCSGEEEEASEVEFGGGVSADDDGYRNGGDAWKLRRNAISCINNVRRTGVRRVCSNLPHLRRDVLANMTRCKLLGKCVWKEKIRIF